MGSTLIEGCCSDSNLKINSSLQYTFAVLF